MTHEQITALTATGESETLEFKHTTGTRREAVSTVCAMLNQRGGHVLFGVTPEGDVVGQQVSAKIQRIEPSAFTAVSEGKNLNGFLSRKIDGSSLACRWLAQKLLHEIGRHQAYFDTQPSDLRSALEDKGLEKAGEMEFELVLLDGLNPSDELIDSLREDQCLSRDLYQMGFAVVERTTRSPIVVSLEE